MSRRIHVTDDNSVKMNGMISSVLGQLSDGMWENSTRMTGYWAWAEYDHETNDIVIDSRDNYYTADYKNPYSRMSDEGVKKFFANKIKQLVRENLKNDYEYKIKTDIYAKYGLKYGSMIIVPLYDENYYERVDAAHKESREYLKANPFNLKGKFNGDNDTELSYLHGYDERYNRIPVTVKEAYRAYRVLCA